MAAERMVLRSLPAVLLRRCGCGAWLSPTWPLTRCGACLGHDRRMVGGLVR